MLPYPDLCVGIGHRLSGEAASIVISVLCACAPVGAINQMSQILYNNAGVQRIINLAKVG